MGKGVESIPLTRAQAGSGESKCGLDAVHKALGGSEIADQNCDVRGRKSAGGAASAIINDRSDVFKAAGNAGQATID